MLKIRQKIYDMCGIINNCTTMVERVQKTNAFATLNSIFYFCFLNKLCGLYLRAKMVELGNGITGSCDAVMLSNF